MDFRYETYEDASMQLNNTVMLTEGGGCVYLSHYDEWLYRVTDLNSYEDNDTEDIREIGLTFEPLVLGYVNYGSEVAYLARKPKRMWKQGLSYDNISVVSGYLHDEILTHPAFAKMLTNDYPSLQDAINLASIGDSTAFNKDAAFIADGSEEIVLAYKGKDIGFVDNATGNLKVNDKYFFLKEHLEEITNEED